MNKNELEDRIKELELELSNLKSSIKATRESANQKEQALMDINDKFVSLADNISGYIAYVNANTLQYEFVNKLHEKSFGIPKEKIIGNHLKDVIGETNYQFALKYINKVKSGKSTSYETTFDFTSGKRWLQVNFAPVIDTNGHVTSIAVLNFDITERKQTEKMLKESESALRDAQEIGKMGSWEWDMVTKKTNWSENYFAIHGFKSTEGEPTFELFRNRIHPDDVHFLDENLANIMKDKTPSSLELRLIQPNGTFKWIQNNISPVIEDDKLVKLKGVIIDITERKLAELALKESEKRLLQLNVDKDLFIAILGHDLRSPFTALLGLSELLTEDLHKLDIDEIETLANQINTTARNTYNLLEDILMWVRAQQGKIPFNPQNLSFTDICKNILETLNLNAKAKNITINYLTRIYLKLST